MKRHLTAIAIAALVPAAAALAQDAGIPAEHLAAVDANADAAVSLEELNATMGAAFDALDANGDGYVSWAEAEVTMTRAHFDGANTNGDDGLSKNEFMDQVARDFAAADQDANGVLD